MDFSCRQKTRTISLTCHSQWKAQQKQISLHELQKFSFKGKISPYPAACTHSWTVPEHQVCVTLRSKGQSCHTPYQMERNTISKPSTCCPVILTSVHMEDVFIVQAWHHNHWQECNAAVYLEGPVNSIVQFHDPVNVSLPANPLLFHKHSTSILQ